jgi:isochorismate synthase
LEISFNSVEEREGDAADVLREAVYDFDSGSSFILASGRETLIASGERRTFTAAPAAGLKAEVSALFAELDPREQALLVVGAIPYKQSEPARLFQPRRLARFYGDLNGSKPALKSRALTAAGQRRGWQVTAEPSRAEYAHIVARALALMECASPSLRKVVLARSLVLRAGHRIDARLTFERLRADRSVTSFCAPLNSEGTRTLVGATPELLLAKSGAAVSSRPLAGSARRSPEPGADRDAAERLSRSEKDMREHAYVRDSILDALAPYCRRLNASDRPFPVATASMWHLATEIAGELRDHQTSSLELALALHPTPAVCGMPGDIAEDVIGELEHVERGFYSGVVGWCDEKGDGQWLVAIRCAEIFGNVARLYAGAGIVAGSDPESEVAETAAKFHALLDALGIEEDERL